MGPIPERDQIMSGWKRDATCGDSCHATMPNIGQGAGLAFEGCYELAKILEKVENRSEVPSTLDSFYKKRILRTAAMQGLGRMNSEAIKILTPLLPIRPLVEYFIGHFCRWCSARSLGTATRSARRRWTRERRARSRTTCALGTRKRRRRRGPGRGAEHTVDRGREQTRKPGA